MNSTFFAKIISNIISEKKIGFIYFTSPIGFEEERVKKISQTLPEKTGVTFGDLANYIRTNKPALINSTVDFRLEIIFLILGLKIN